MNSIYVLTFFELLTIILSITIVIIGVKELFSKKEKTIYLIKKSIITISAITVISAIGTWYFSNKVSYEKENELNSKMLNAEENISKNKANTSAAILKSDSLKNELQKAELKIEKAKSEREDLVVKTLTLRNENLKLSIKLQEEQNKRNELIGSIAPRSLEQFHFSNHLKKYKNIKIILECIAKEETISTLGQLNFIFKMADWEIISTKIVNPNPMIREDINIYRNVGAIPKDDISNEAANAMITQFKLNDIEADIRPITGLSTNTLKIIIGEKSNNFIREWTSQNIELRLENIASIKKQLSIFKENKFKELIRLYPLGFLIFAIDKDENVIPGDNNNMNFLTINWDNAKIDSLFERKTLQLPSIIYTETGDKIVEDHNEVALKKTKNKEQIRWLGFRFTHIEAFFEILEANDYGIFCIIGFKKS